MYNQQYAPAQQMDNFVLKDMDPEDHEAIAIREVLQSRKIGVDEYILSVDNLECLLNDELEHKDCGFMDILDIPKGSQLPVCKKEDCYFKKVFDRYQELKKIYPNIDHDKMLRGKLAVYKFKLLYGKIKKSGYKETTGVV